MYTVLLALAVNPIAVNKYIISQKKKGRPKRTWADGIRGLMGEKGLMEDDWNDRSNWRKKIL